MTRDGKQRQEWVGPRDRFVTTIAPGPQTGRSPLRSTFALRGVVEPPDKAQLARYMGRMQLECCSDTVLANLTGPGEHAARVGRNRDLPPEIRNQR